MMLVSPTWPSLPERSGCPLAGTARLWYRRKTDFRNLPLALTVSMYLNLSCHISYLWTYVLTASGLFHNSMNSRRGIASALGWSFLVYFLQCSDSLLYLFYGLTRTSKAWHPVEAAAFTKKSLKVKAEFPLYIISVLRSRIWPDGGG